MPFRVLLQSKFWEFVISNSDTYVHENDASYVKGNTRLWFVVSELLAVINMSHKLWYNV